MAENSNETCPNTRDVILMGVNNIERQAMFFHPACKKWDCPYCSTELVENWKHVIARGSQILLSEGRMMQFVTLTSRGGLTPGRSIYFFKQNFPKFRKRLEYITEKWQDVTQTPFSYFVVPERHASGVLHCHGLFTTFQDTRKWYKNTAHQCGFGYMADVQNVETSAGAIAYIAKYLGKDFGGVIWPKNFMRVRHSRNWPMVEAQKDELWEWQSIQEGEFLLEKGALIDMGYHVIDKVSQSVL